MAKLKVLAISYLFPNIVQPNHGIFVYNRLNALSHLVDLKVINPIPWSPLHSQLTQYSALEQVPLQTHRGNLEIYHPRFFSIPKFFKSIESFTFQQAVTRVLKHELRAFEFDIIDLHWTFPDLPAGVMLSRTHNKPFMVTLRGMEAFHQQDLGLRKHIVQHCLKQASAVVALSEELKETSLRLGTLAAKHFVVRNGVDTGLFTFVAQAEARQKLALPEMGKIIVTVGSLIRRKGFDLIIQALPDVIRQTEGQVKLYIIGAQGPEGDFRAELYEQVKQLDLEDNVVFQGSVPNEDLLYWYNAADLFCLASRGEGSPNVLTEALACGCPAVATDVGAVSEIMASEKMLGQCVPSEDVFSLGKSMSSILLSNYAREENAKIYSRYHWNWCAENTFQVYKKLVED